MTQRPAKDLSNGYDAIVDDYIAARSSSGRDLVSGWAEGLPSASTVLDLGAGYGQPVTAALAEAGHKVFAIEASPAMVAEFKHRFPNIPIACEAVEQSDFFGRTFDAVSAIGLIFLLPEAQQRRLIKRVARVLRSQGAFLFSAPVETGQWKDILTGQMSSSLGEETYRGALKSAGFAEIASLTDEAGSHYYAAAKV